MAIPIIVGCPRLVLSSRHGDVAISSFDNSVGAVVTFNCTDEGDFLSGAPVISCTPSGTWNDSIPFCISLSEKLSSMMTSSTTVAVNSTSSLPTTERNVEIVILILWIAGGFLLILLVVLIGCILRSHQKIRRNSSQPNNARQRGHPRHGGVNPSFTNYDEIWTWIPVVTESSENCRSQINPVTRTSCANQQNNLLSALRLPSYTEAVRGNSSQAVTTVASSNVRNVPRSSSHVVSNSTQNQNSNNSTSRNNNTQISAQDNNRPTESIAVSVISENHYETIPADIRTLPIATSTLRGLPNASTTQTSQTHCHVSVTTGANTCAMSSPHVQSSRAEIRHTSRATTNTTRAIESQITSSNLNNLETRALPLEPAHSSNVQRHRELNPRGDHRRGIRIDEIGSGRRGDNNSRHSRADNRAHRSRSSEHTERQRGAYVVRPVTEFSHSSASAFAYYAGAQYPYGDPYDVSRQYSVRADGLQVITPSAPVVRLDYEYF